MQQRMYDAPPGAYPTRSVSTHFYHLIRRYHGRLDAYNTNTTISSHTAHPANRVHVDAPTDDFTHVEIPSAADPHADMPPLEPLTPPGAPPASPRGQTEIDEDAPMPDVAADHPGPFAVVWAGTLTGVFTNTSFGVAYTTGVSRSGQKNCATREQAWECWKDNCVAGIRRGELSPLSIFPVVVPKVMPPGFLPESLASLDEDAPMPNVAVGHTGPLAVVWVGTFTGVFTNTSLATAYTDGVSCSAHKNHGTREAAWEAWRACCLDGTRRGPLSPRSIFPAVVRKGEQGARADSTPDARESTAATPADSGAQPGSTAQPDIAPSSDTAQNRSDSAPNAAPIDDFEYADPPAWVVIRGRRPGVYYKRTHYMRARGDSWDAWAIPAVSVAAADAIYLRHQELLHVMNHAI